MSCVRAVWAYFRLITARWPVGEGVIVGKPVVYFLAAALCALVAWQGVRMPEWVRWFAAFTAVCFATAGIVELLDYLAGIVIDRRTQYRHIETITAARELVIAMAALSPVAQLELATKFPAVLQGFGRLGLAHGMPMVAWSVRLGGEDVSLSFLREFLEKSDHRSLYPVRSYAEGSIARRHAVLITNWLVQAGYAEAASGNQAARWLPGRRELVCEFFGGYDE
jgi:hypothetical protein